MIKKIWIPAWLKEHEQESFFEKFYRYIVVTGGRGSGKTYLVALYLVLQAITKPKQKILCTRQFHKSLQKSVGECLIKIIDSLNLSDQFKFTKNELKCKNGSEFLFIGFDRNRDAIKGLEGITHCWIEEADTLTRESWNLLRPTIFRTLSEQPNLFSKESYEQESSESKSQIIITMNPKYETDCLYHDFFKASHTPPLTYKKHLNWDQNPFFSKSMHYERLLCKINNPDVYKHIWEGELLQYSDAQIFKGRWFIQDFQEDPEATKYFGIDFGFSQDPLAVVRTYISGKNIYVTHEFHGKRIVNEDIYDLIKDLPDIQHSKIYGDCSKPEAIATLNRQGLFIEPSDKSAISSTYMKDCIEALRSYNIIVKPNCINLISNLNLYSYKIDERIGLVTDKIIDGNDDFIDALKYALIPVIKQLTYNIENLSLDKFQKAFNNYY